MEKIEVRQVIPVLTEDSYVTLTEMPDHSIELRGIRTDLTNPDSTWDHPVYLSHAIRFSKGAIRAMLPLLSELVKE